MLNNYTIYKDKKFLILYRIRIYIYIYLGAHYIKRRHLITIGRKNIVNVIKIKLNVNLLIMFLVCDNFIETCIYL